MGEKQKLCEQYLTDLKKYLRKFLFVKDESSVYYKITTHNVQQFSNRLVYRQTKYNI